MVEEVVVGGRKEAEERATGERAPLMMPSHLVFEVLHGLHTKVGRAAPSRRKVAAAVQRLTRLDGLGRAESPSPATLEDVAERAAPDLLEDLHVVPVHHHGGLDRGRRRRASCVLAIGGITLHRRLRPVTLGIEVRLRARQLELAHRGEVPLPDRLVNGSDAPTIRDIYAGARRNEHLQHLRVAFTSRQVHRGAVVVVGAVRVGALGEQQPGRVRVTLGCGNNERLRMIAYAATAASVAQRLGDLRKAMTLRVVKRGAAPPV